MNISNNKWVYLIILAIVWGSSFILMKKGLIGLSPIELGAFRILFAGLFLLITSFKSIKRIQPQHWKYIVITALLGTFIPVFLFAYAVNGIDSSIASILNSLTPFNTFLVGMMFFQFMVTRRQVIGILIGLIGTILLIFSSSTMNPNQNYFYALLVIISSVGYGFNVNIIKRHLSDIPALSITTGNFLVVVIPAFIVLVLSGFFNHIIYDNTTLSSLGYILILAIIGTAIAKVLFNQLIQMSSPIFSSSVTYLIPIVAVIWGIIDGEKLSFIQLVSGAIILFGVYLVNKRKKVKS